MDAESFAKWKKRRQRRLKREREHAIATGLIEYVEPRSACRLPRGPPPASGEACRLPSPLTPRPRLRAGKFTGKELFTKDRSLFSMSDDKTRDDGAAASGAAEDAADAGAAATDAAAGVVGEENAALFLDEVELDDIEDDDEVDAAEGGAAAGAEDAAAPAAAAPASTA